MPHPQSLNIGSYVTPKNGGQLATVTAGAGADNVEQNGPAIDRSGYDSANIAILTRANLAATKTLTISATLQESDDGVTFADVLPEFQPGGLVGGGIMAVITTTGDAHATTEYNVNLRGLRQYIRVQYTVDLSNTVTDTVNTAVIVTLGGGTTLPV